MSLMWIDFNRLILDLPCVLHSVKNGRICNGRGVGPPTWCERVTP
jgi:hypothetical protein